MPDVKNFEQLRVKALKDAKAGSTVPEQSVIPGTANPCNICNAASPDTCTCNTGYTPTVPGGEEGVDIYP